MRQFLNRQESEKSIGDANDHNPRNYIRKPRYTFRSPNLSVMGPNEQKMLEEELIGSSVIIGQESLEGALRNRL